MSRQLITQYWAEFRSAARANEQSGATIAERAIQRNRRATLAGVTAATARVVQLGTSLVSVPLTLHYLGTERFGLWITISSFLAVAGVADFGLGNGLLNVVATAYGKDDLENLRRAISSALACLSGIGACVLAIFLASYRFVPWAEFFKVSTVQARAEAGPALLAFVLCFALSLPTSVVQRVQLGLQQGFRTNVWLLVGNLTGLFGLLICISIRASLPALILAIAGVPLLAGMLNGILFFGSKRRDLRPRLSYVSAAAIKQIMAIGALFFVLQVVVALAYSADNIVVARVLGAVNVPEYAVPQRMFSVVTMMIAMLISPLWPAYGEAIARGDVSWVKRSLKRSLILAGGFALVASTTLLLAARPLIHWWIGAALNPPTLLLVGLAIWTIMECCGNALSAFLNGSGFVHFQIALACLFGVSCIGAKVFLTRRYGVAGLPWATICTWGLLTLLPLLFYVRVRLRRMTAAPNHPLPAVR